MSKLTKMLCVVLVVVFAACAMLVSCTDKSGADDNTNVNADANNNADNNNTDNVADNNDEPANVVFDSEGNEIQLGDNDAQWQW